MVRRGTPKRGSLSTIPKQPNPREPSSSAESDLKRAENFRKKGNQHFTEKEYPKAIENYEHALKLIPKYHPDSALCHTNIVSCLEKIEPIDYTLIISECSLALEAIPKYPKALLKRAKVYEKTDQTDLALQDVDAILGIECILNDAKEMRQRLDPACGARVDSDREANVPPMDHCLIEFAKLYGDGIDLDTHIKLYSLGMGRCAQALDDTITSEKAQPLFDDAALNFQEVAALGLFNWGNIHMCSARKRFPTDSSATKEVMEENLKLAYDWAKDKYALAKEKYEEAVKIKPDFYNVLLAIGQQQFEMAKLYWSTKNVMSEWDSSEMFKLFDSSEEKMRNVLEKLERERGKQVSDAENEELAGQRKVMRSRVNLFWGNLLFERSQIEFMLTVAGWKEKMIGAEEKFKLAGAGRTYITKVMMTHCSLGSEENKLNVDQTQNSPPNRAIEEENEKKHIS